MGVKKIRVTNFKSFKELEVELGKFNVLIGANASGKSNFVQIFKFLRDIANSGLNNAVSMQGVEYLRNINIGASENFSVKVASDKEFGLLGRRTKGELIGIKIYETTYEFALKFNKRGSGFRIAEDKLTQKCKFVKLDEKKKKIEEKEALGEGELIVSHTNGKVKIDLHKPEGVPIEKDDIYPPFLEEQRLTPNTLLLETPFFFIPPLEVEQIFSGISIYDFDPKLPKKATPITGKAELEEDGSNLSIVLKNITENKEKEESFLIW